MTKKSEPKDNEGEGRHPSGGAFTTPPPGLDTSFPDPSSLKEAKKSGEAHKSGGAFEQAEEGEYPTYEDTLDEGEPKSKKKKG